MAERRTNPTRTGVADRGGASRRAHSLQRAAKRASGEELLGSLFGDIAPYFAENPLDGGNMLSAVPRQVPNSGAPQAPVQTLSADDPVTDQATWFRGTEREGQKSTKPPSVAKKPAKPMSIAEAAQAAQNGLAVERILEGPDPSLIVTGLPGDGGGDDYDDLLDEIVRPPNTY